MRILWVVSKLTWEGGIGRAVAGAIAGLVARGHTPHVVGPCREGSLPPAIAGASLHRMPARPSKLGRLRHLDRVARQLRPDVVHFHSAMPHGEVILGARTLKRSWGNPALVVTPHSGSRSHYPKARSRLGLHACDLVIAPSRFSAERAVAAGVSPSKVRVVYAGIDLPRLPGNARERVVLTMARLVRNKGVDRVISAFERFLEERPTAALGWRLEIAGSGSEEPFLRELALRSKHAGRIRFLGYLRGAEKTAALARASVGVIASSIESFGGVLLEFQAHGVPAIATETGGMAELARGGETARLVPVGDRWALTSALGKLVEDEKLREQLARCARRFAEEFNWSTTAEQYETHYVQLRDRK